jgi:hypothetical protein
LSGPIIFAPSGSSEDVSQVVFITAPSRPDFWGILALNIQRKGTVRSTLLTD